MTWTRVIMVGSAVLVVHLAQAEDTRVAMRSLDLPRVASEKRAEGAKHERARRPLGHAGSREAGAPDTQVEVKEISKGLAPRAADRRSAHEAKATVGADKVPGDQAGAGAIDVSRPQAPTGLRIVTVGR